MVVPVGSLIKDGIEEWTALRYLKQGNKILGITPGIVDEVHKVADNIAVVRITVKDAKSYQTSGLIGYWTI